MFVPALLIYVFWMIHILPEKIAERRGHPQADAIKTLCLLSLVFGGMLWPIAWLWAYSKPVLLQDGLRHRSRRASRGGTARATAARTTCRAAPRGADDLAAIDAVPGEH